ncbi:retrovirus-related pol polyprotein from transposon TNT 1-94 [Tanacetum coccineum]
MNDIWSTLNSLEKELDNLNQEKAAFFKHIESLLEEYVKSLEKEIDELESEKADFSNIYDLLLEECVSKDVTCSYLHSLSDLNAYAELQCLYLHKVKECECLAQKLSKQTESVNKEVHNKLLKSFAKLENHSISLELALQQCKEQMKNNSVCKENGSNVFQKEREQYHEIQDLKAQMQDKNIAISELQKLIEKCKGKSVETQFDKPSNLPQNRKQAEIHSNVLKPGMYRIATTTTQTRTPQLPHASRNTNPYVSKSTRVNHYTSVSRPQLKSYQVKDKVMPNNSQVKFNHKEVEEHHRILSISRKTKSITVTACNDSQTQNFNEMMFVLNIELSVSRNVTIQNGLFVEASITFFSSGNDLLTGSRGSNLYTISLQETTSSTPIYFMAKASPNQAWLWHRRLSHLNFDYITLLSKKDIMTGLPKLKYVKDQVCSSCEMSKAKISSFKTKAVPSSKGMLNLLHMDLCGQMRLQAY